MNLQGQNLPGNNTNRQKMAPTTPSQKEVSEKTWILPEKMNRYSNSVLMEYECRAVFSLLSLFSVDSFQARGPDQLKLEICKHQPPTYFQTSAVCAFPRRPLRPKANVRQDR